MLAHLLWSIPSCCFAPVDDVCVFVFEAFAGGNLLVSGSWSRLACARVASAPSSPSRTGLFHYITAILKLNGIKEFESNVNTIDH
jgi:hypothetical protein